MHQLRIYDITPGRMDEFVALFWRVAEIRRLLGFEVLGPWINEETNQFVWIVGYDGPGTFEEATQAYYDSPERASISPSPAEFLETVDTRMLTAVRPT
jgi:hypothetical protein